MEKHKTYVLALPSGKAQNKKNNLKQVSNKIILTLLCF